MPATYIEFNTGGLFYGWSNEDVERIDKDATEESLIKILRDIAPKASIVIKWEDGNDKIFGEFADANEEEDIRAELREFPWYDAQRWAVFK